MTAARVCHALLIDDNPDDILLFERAFRKSGIPCCMHSVNTISDAMAYLKSDPPFDDARRYPAPDLIITDLAFRGESGLHFLTWLRSQAKFQRIPIICLSGSSDPAKLDQARAFGAECIEKSVHFEHALARVRELLPT